MTTCLFDHKICDFAFSTTTTCENIMPHATPAELRARAKNHMAKWRELMITDTVAAREELDKASNLALLAEEAESANGRIRTAEGHVPGSAEDDAEWDGLDCACGGGWKVGHSSGCPESGSAAIGRLGE